MLRKKPLAEQGENRRRMRLFIGFRLSAPAIESVERLRSLYRPCFKRSVAWVPAENLHLTCAFLGEVSSGAGRLADIKKSMDAAAGEFRKIEAAFGGLGGFPSLEHPRVLWLGVTEGADKLKELALRLAGGLKSAGFVSESGSLPHLTLGRVKFPPDGEALAAASDKAREPGVRDTFGCMELLESRLSDAGADHRTLYSSRLL